MGVIFYLGKLDGKEKESHASASQLRGWKPDKNGCQVLGGKEGKDSWQGL